MDDSSGGQDWSSILSTGVSALIDSQVAKNYAATQPVYNTAGGTGGQSQFAAVTSNPVMLVCIVGILATVVFLAVRR